MSRSRVTELGASFVCSVLNTMCPVSDACTAISAVSGSRISPTRITSGSCRKIARKQWAKVFPIEASIGTWMMPFMSYSIGSSVVISLSSILFKSLSAEYNVVVLPEPVGPVTSTIPFGLSITSRKAANVCGVMPTASKSSFTTERSNTRITTHSPNIVGMTETRRSTGWPPSVNSIRPSCGRRRSAMSRLAMTLIRVVIAKAKCFGGGTISNSTPSALMRILNSSSNGSK